VGQTIALRGLSFSAEARKVDRRQKAIVCPATESRGWETFSNLIGHPFV
jgi:hypothetical protein